MRKDMWYEIRYLLSGPALLWLYLQYVITYRWANAPDHITWLLLPICGPLAILFVVQNIIFNATFGSFIFWDRPRYLFFTDRINNAEEHRKVRYRKLMNPHDPNHIT